MEPWEDELLWDDDFSDEEEDTEEQIEEADLELDEDSFADWEDSSDTAPVDETLEEALAEERTLELESELEQDEHPRDYHAELEDEEEEAAPTSEKRLKREICAEALRRLEEAARTESDFLTVVDEWNKLDRNRERRERDHENLRGDVPLEFQAVPDPKIAPLWMNLPRFRQLCQGNFLDIIFSCPYELHELTANRFLSKLFFTLSDEQKEVLYYLFIKQYSTTRLAAIRGQSDRNIRKLRMTIQKKLQRRMYEHLSEKLEKDYEYVRKSELWWKLNDEMEQLCQELRRYTVFRLLPDDCYDAFFSVIREITGQFSLFPPEEHSLSEYDQTKLLSASAEEFFQSDDGDSDPEISLGLLDLFRRREGSEEKGELFYYEMFRLLGACEDTWSAYKKYIDRYMMYLHDIRAFVPTIRNFIKFILSTLTTNGPESYAAALYGFYNDDRTAEKLIVNPITYHGDCYRRHDEYMLSYVPRELPDGSMAICQEHVTDSLQALMKADF